MGEEGIDFERVIGEAAVNVAYEKEKAIRNAVERSLVVIQEAELVLNARRNSHSSLLAAIRAGKFDFLAEEMSRVRNGR